MSESKHWPTMSIAEAHARLSAPGCAFEFEETIIRGVPTRVWKRDPGTLRRLFEASLQHGDRTFLVYGRERVTFDAFGRAVTELSHRLAAAGVGRGDRVALAMSNRPEWCVVFMAATAVGAIVVPLNGWWTARELAYGLADSGARLVFADGERAARLAPVRGELRGLRIVNVDDAALPDASRDLAGDVMWLGPSGGAGGGWAALEGRALPPADIAPDDDATIFYTSGTTGHPKGALGTHRNAVFSTVAMGVSGERLRLRGGSPPVVAGQRAVLLSVPLFHVTGCFSRFVPALAGGSKLVLMPRWDAAEALRVMHEESVTAAGGVPTVALQLLDLIEAGAAPPASLSALSYGGAPASPDLVARIRRLLPAAVPGVGYGMTETSSIMTHHQGEEYAAYPDTCGPTLPPCEMKVVDAAGHTLPPGEVGVLMCRGPNVVKGYWNKPAETAEAFRDGWLWTGDLARFDAEGNCAIVDRMKDMIIRGGENIYCVEVEHALEAFPDVKEAALVGLPHPTLGEEPAAVLYAGKGIDLPALRAFMAGRLARYKLPVRYRVMTEPLARNANGKVVKKGMRELFEPLGDS